MDFNGTKNNFTCQPSRGQMLFIRYLTGKYIFPPLFVIGVIGNTLNLFVLNSKGMRNKTNVFLSAMAVSDLCFLICSLPMEMLITFDDLRNSHRFMSFYVNSRMTLVVTSNWFSAASIWIAVLVTVERVIAIKAPLQAKFWWKTHKIVLALTLIYAISLAGQLYNYVWATPVIKHLCGNVYQYGLQFINATEFPELNAYVQISMVITPILIVVVPTILLIVLNSCLLYYLCDNRKNLAYSTKTPQQQGNELRVACTVSIIVLAFILCTSPSAILMTYGAAKNTWVKSSELYTAAVTVANLLVIVGKALNFVLYCSSSKHFRRKLIGLFSQRQRFNRTGHDSSQVRGASQRRRSTLTSVMDTVASDITHNSAINWLVNVFRPRKCTIETRLVNGNPMTAAGQKRQCFKERQKTADYGRLLPITDPFHRPAEYLKGAERRYTHPIETAAGDFDRLVEAQQTNFKITNSTNEKDQV